MKKKVLEPMMTIGLDLIASLREIRLENKKKSHAHALLWLINRRATEACTYTKNSRSWNLNAGEIMSSYEEMSRAWGWDIKTVRAFVENLVNGGYVTVRPCYYGVVLNFPSIYMSEVEIETEDDPD